MSIITKLRNRRAFKHLEDMPLWGLVLFFFFSSLALWALSPVANLPLEYAQVFNEHDMTLLGAKSGGLIVFSIVIPSICFAALTARCSNLLSQRLFR